MLKLGIQSDFYGELSLEDAIRHLADIGYRHMEISWHHLKPMLEAGNCEKRLLEVKKTLEEAGSTAWQIHSPAWDLASSNEKSRQSDIDIVIRCLECCRLMNIPFLVVHPGGYEGFSCAQDLAHIKRWNVESFARLADQATQFGVKILLENLLDSHCPRSRQYGALPSELEEIIEEIDSDSLGINLDIGHLNIQRIDVAETILEVKERLCSTHVHDNWGVIDEHLFPLEGNMNWQEIMDAFKTAGYSNALILELKGGNESPYSKLKDAKLDLLRRRLERI